MKVAFVQALPVMLDSYLILSACLKKCGIESEVFIESFEQNIVENIVGSNPDLVGFNCLTGSYYWALAVAKKIKQIKNIPIVLGGAHPTYYSENVDFNIINYICVGEGESAIVELAEAIRDRNSDESIKNIVVKRNGKIKVNPIRPLIKDLGSLPFSYRALYYKYEYFLNLDVYSYRTNRGCPYNCTFCFAGKMAKLYNNQKVFRYYPINYIIEELSEIKKSYKKLRMILFNDEIFGVDKERAHKLLLLYKKKIGLPYRITTRADLISVDFVKLLKDTGCDLVDMSVETGNEKIRKNVLNKNISNQTIIKAGRRLHDVGVKTRVSCIFCLPDETLENAFESIELMKQMKATDPVGFLLQPFPKTPIYDYAVQKGYVKKEINADDLDSLVYFKTPMNIPDKKKILVVQRLFVYACKIPYFNKLLRVLVNIPVNPLFDIMHKLGIALSHKRFYRLNWIGLVKYLLSAKKLDTKKPNF
ncbi:MAG: B12-binding domain-containing radical SAM protein [Candidatus Omnitrophica bacterium]|nr:B12-binding domain-containing radical SAM protein [Candidatus Omnitrophota bacterium]